MTPAQETKAKIYQALGYQPLGMVGENLTVVYPLKGERKEFYVQIIAPPGAYWVSASKAL